MDSESQQLEVSTSAEVCVGSYRMISLRGRRSDCEVWTALHRPTEMEVVMEIYPKSGDDKQLVESIVRKIDSFADLAGGKVLRLLEVIDAEVAIFLVYEGYSSQSLLQYALNCPLNGKEFQRIVRSLIKIVRGLHRNCIFHGTLGIDSFVLTRQKKVKFKDAPSCHTFLRSHTEPARFDAILSKASDVWSIGAIIYRLISHQLDSGLLPTAAGSSNAEAVVKVVSELDSDLSDLLNRMTDQNPAARISTADCLRHPYLTRSGAAAALSLDPSRRDRVRAAASGVRINLDIVRYLSRATGAPEADLAAAASANDLSSWCAAYWLLKLRLAAGRGHPALTSDDVTASSFGNGSALNAAADRKQHSEKTTDEDIERKSTTTAAAAAAAAATTSSQSRQDTGYRQKVALLRSRRLGLTSPRETTTTGAATPRKRQPQQQLQQHQREWDTLPPITVRSAGHSERTQRSMPDDPWGSQSSQRRLPEQQQKQAAQQSLLTSRYLTYIRKRELDALVERAGAAPPPQQTAAVTAEAESRGTSAIRVRVQRRKAQENQQQQQRQPAKLTPSPRQPPNSRTDLGRPPDAGGEKREPEDEAGEDAGDPVADEAALETQYLWENALVRWPQWLSSREIC